MGIQKPSKASPWRAKGILLTSARQTTHSQINRHKTTRAAAHFAPRGDNKHPADAGHLAPDTMWRCYDVMHQPAKQDSDSPVIPLNTEITKGVGEQDLVFPILK